MEDIVFEMSKPIPPLVTVKNPKWQYRFETTELWDDGFYHPIYVPYCVVNFHPNPLLVFPEDDMFDFEF